MDSQRAQQLITFAAVIALAAFTLIRFREAVLGFYFLDDFWVLRDASLTQINSIGDLQQFFWFGHGGFRLYRPLTTNAYSYFLQALFGFDSSAHHAFQLLVFLCSVLLVVAIVRRLTRSTIAGLSAGALCSRRIFAKGVVAERHSGRGSGHGTGRRIRDQQTFVPSYCPCWSGCIQGHI